MLHYQKNHRPGQNKKIKINTLCRKPLLLVGEEVPAAVQYFRGGGFVRAVTLLFSIIIIILVMFLS